MVCADKTQGQNRETGLQEFSARKITGRQVLVGAVFKTRASVRVFCVYLSNILTPIPKTRPEG